jgi:hypothetical protein
MASRPTRKRLTELEAVATHGCPTGKVGYLTRAQAFETAEWRMQLGQVNPGCHLTPIECPDCGLWHVYNRRIHFERVPDIL